MVSWTGDPEEQFFYDKKKVFRVYKIYDSRKCEMVTMRDFFTSIEVVILLREANSTKETI